MSTDKSTTTDDCRNGHKWDRDGERCERCGIKDWMVGGIKSDDQAQSTETK